jgi:uncharacterized membrane protein (DUF4010 family)
MILGILGGAAGLLIAESYVVVAAALAAGGIALSVAAYVMAVRRPEADLDGTTEAAAALVIALGVLAGVGWLALSAGTGSLIVLALREKTRLHDAVRHLQERELRSASQFAVLALVVLPLLPEGPLWGALAVRPRVLWAVVLLFSGLNFAGFVARRAVGPERGYGVMGLLGGVVSSTAVTLNFARHSRREPDISRALAGGVIGACTVLIPRVLVVTTALNPQVALALARLLVAPAVVGAAAFAWVWRTDRDRPAAADETTLNPLRLGAAIRMTIAFQVAMTAIALVRDRWGTAGLFTTASLLGLTDVDALAVSMSRLDAAWLPSLAGRAIAIGILSNTIVKLTIAAALGAARFRVTTIAGLAAIAAGIALSLWFL